MFLVSRNKMDAMHIPCEWPATRNVALVWKREYLGVDLISLAHPACVMSTTVFFPRTGNFALFVSALTTAVAGANPL